MNDFLRDLVGRTLGVQDVVRPRLASTFEPGGIAPGAVAMEPLEVAVAGEAVSPAPTVRRPVVASQREVAPAQRDVAAAQREGSPAQQPPRPNFAASSTTLPQPVEEGTALDAAPGPHVAPVAAVPEPRATEPAHPAVDVPSASEPARRPARVPGRNAPSPRAASPPEQSAATQPAGPATARARAVKTRVVERRGEAPRRTAELPVASERPPATGEAAAGAPEPGSAEPVVHVHIGRIEVRTPAAPERPRAPRPREPRLSLDDYLAQTRQARR